MSADIDHAMSKGVSTCSPPSKILSKTVNDLHYYSFKDSSVLLVERVLICCHDLLTIMDSFL